MLTVIYCIVLSVLAAALIPSAKSMNPQAAEPVVLFIEESETASAENARSSDAVSLLKGEETITLDEKEYLTAVVLSEMPSSFDIEALKAQAVAARTFLYRQRETKKHESCDVCADSTCCQAWTDRESLQARFGADYEAYLQKAEQAVTETAGEVLVYDGALIDATYFSCSGGSTESAVAVWGSEVPYLQSVISPGEEGASKFATELTFSDDDFANILRTSSDAVDLTDRAENWVGEVTLTEGGGVDTIMLGGAAFRGTQVRQMFGLNSAKFTLSHGDDGFTFQVLGYGHRVGMSQYGADNMARCGFDYQTILRYYYRGADIKKTAPGEPGAVFDQ